jgi:hypothetical protein
LFRLLKPEPAQNVERGELDRCGFLLAQLQLSSNIKSQYEKVRQNSLFNSRSDDLCDWIFCRSTCVQEERQELPDE